MKLFKVSAIVELAILNSRLSKLTQRRTMDLFGKELTNFCNNLAELNGYNVCATVYVDGTINTDIIINEKTNNLWTTTNTWLNGDKEENYTIIRYFGANFIIEPENNNNHIKETSRQVREALSILNLLSDETSNKTFNISQRLKARIVCCSVQAIPQRAKGIIINI